VDCKELRFDPVLQETHFYPLVVPMVDIEPEHHLVFVVRQFLLPVAQIDLVLP